MAVFRKGGMYRKASNTEAQQMQDRQAKAALRKLHRRLHIPRHACPYCDFLVACMDDIGHSAA